MREFLEETFPSLAARIPEGAKPVEVEFRGGGGTVWCNHPEHFAPSLIFGGFVDSSSVPDGFVAVGIYTKGGGERVVAMWREGERRFLLVHRYMEATIPSDMQESSRIVDEALRRWQSGASIVGSFEGQWYDPKTGSWR